MLSKAHRIYTAQFSDIFKKGRKTHSDYFSIISRSDTDLERFRLAIVASKKVSGKAVVRNRLKRRAREVFRKQYGSIKQNYWIVCSIKPAAANLTPQKFAEELVNVLQKAKVLTQPPNIE